MMTHTHLIMTVALDQFIRRKLRLKPRSRALILGGVMPDMPIWLLGSAYLLRLSRERVPDVDAAFEGFDHHYFNNTRWIVSHNVFHAPPILVFILALSYWGMRRGREWGLSLLWFALGASVHAAVDIVTHHHDGPLLMFPLEWRTRFRSPVSYYDRQHYGLHFATLEQFMNLGLLVFLWRGWQLRRRLQQQFHQHRTRSQA